MSELLCKFVWRLQIISRSDNRNFRVSINKQKSQFGLNESSKISLTVFSIKLLGWTSRIWPISDKNGYLQIKKCSWSDSLRVPMFNKLLVLLSRVAMTWNFFLKFYRFNNSLNKLSTYVTHPTAQNRTQNRTFRVSTSVNHHRTIVSNESSLICNSSLLQGQSTGSRTWLTHSRYTIFTLC